MDMSKFLYKILWKIFGSLILVPTFLDTMCRFRFIIFYIVFRDNNPGKTIDYLRTYVNFGNTGDIVFCNYYHEIFSWKIRRFRFILFFNVFFFLWKIREIWWVLDVLICCFWCEFWCKKLVFEICFFFF